MPNILPTDIVELTLVHRLQCGPELLHQAVHFRGIGLEVRTERVDSRGKHLRVCGQIKENHKALAREVFTMFLDTAIRGVRYRRESCETSDMEKATPKINQN